MSPSRQQWTGTPTSCPTRSSGPPKWQSALWRHNAVVRRGMILSVEVSSCLLLGDLCPSFAALHPSHLGRDSSPV